MVENRVPLKYSTNCTGMIQPSATQNFFIITYLSAVMHTNQCFNKNSWATITKQICVKKQTLWHISHCFQLPRFPSYEQSMISSHTPPTDLVKGRLRWVHIHVGRLYQVHIHAIFCHMILSFMTCSIIQFYTFPTDHFWSWCWFW